MAWLNHTSITIAHFVYCPHERSLSITNTKLKIVLSEQCVQILNILCLRAQTEVSREVLIASIWGDKFETGNKGLNQVIWQLRKAFEQLDESCANLIVRVPKKGYILNAQVTVSWQYNDLPAAQDTLQLHHEHLEYRDVSIPVNTVQHALLVALSERSSPVKLLNLCVELSVDIDTLLTVLGELQFNFCQHHPHAALLKTWDQREVSFFPVKNAMHDTPLVSQNEETGCKSSRPNTIHHPKSERIKLSRSFFLALICTSVVSLLAACYLGWLLHNHPKGDAQNIVHEHRVLSHFTRHQFDELIKIHEDKGQLSILEVLNVSAESLNHINDTDVLTSLDHALTLTELGFLNFKFDRYSESEQQLQQAIDIAEHSVSEPDAKRRVKLVAQNHLIEMHIAAGNYVKAELLLNNALQLTSYLHANEEDIVDLLHVRQLELYVNTGKFGEAKMLSEHLLSKLRKQDIQHKTTPPFYQEYMSPQLITGAGLRAEILNLYSIALRQLNDLDKAIEALQQLLALEIEQHGDQHESAISRYISLAVIYTFNGQIEHALQYFETAIALHKKLYGEKSSNLPVMLSNQSYALFEAGKTAQALAAVNEAIAIDEHHFGSEPTRSAFIYLAKATHEFHLGNVNDAQATIQRALQGFQTATHIRHPMHGRALELQAHIHRLNKDVILCQSHMNLAMDIYQESFKDPNHWITKSGKISVAACELMAEIKDKAALQEHEQMSVLLNDLIQEVGANALPVRYIYYKLLLGK